MVYLELFLSFVMIGFTSFGGMSMIPLINQEMISHGWMTASEVADIVAIAEMTPGPLGLNCATFAGMRTAGIPGAAAATIGVLFPSVTLCLLAAVFLSKFKENKIMGYILHGIRPVCIGIIATIIVQQAMTNYSGTFYGVSPASVLIGIVALVMLIRFKWTIPKVILLSAVTGLIFCR